MTGRGEVGEHPGRGHDQGTRRDSDDVAAEFESGADPREQLLVGREIAPCETSGNHERIGNRGLRDGLFDRDRAQRIESVDRPRFRSHVIGRPAQGGEPGHREFEIPRRHAVEREPRGTVAHARATVLRRVSRICVDSAAIVDSIRRTRSGLRPARTIALAIVAGFVVSLVSLLAGGAAAQTPGNVTGTVSADGTAVEGVSITVRDGEGAKVGGGFTTADGTYTIPIAEPGDYTVALDPQTLPDDVAFAPTALQVEITLDAAGAVVDFDAAAGEEPPVGGGEEVRGTLRRPNPDTQVNEPVAGVTVRAELDGEPVGEAVSGADGTWSIPLPGPGTYTVVLVVETLPEGVDLRNEGSDRLTKQIVSGQSSPLLFQLGDRVNRATDSLYERSIRLFFDGLNYGLIIAICAIGLSLIFGTTGLTNFAHGELVTFGAVVAILFNDTFGLHILIAAPIAIVFGAGFGALQDLGLWRPLRQRGVGLNTAMIVSIGFGLALRYVMLYQFGGDPRKYEQYQIQPDGLDIGPATISPKDLTSMVLAVAVLVGVALMLQRTRIGKAMRAVSDNRDLAASSGIDVQRVILTVWVLGGGLSAFGGVLLGLDEDVTWDMGFRLLLLIFAGVTLGGLGTAYGALVGSLVVGQFVILSTLWIKPELKNVGALVVLILVLLVRPQGILGRKERVG